MSPTASSLDSAEKPNQSWAQRLHEIRTGFERPFWVANVSELFERLSYYAAFASLPRYLHENLSFGVERASSLAGLFGGLVWFLAAFGGALADRIGFRRALSLAYLILTISYFLLGSIAAPWLAPVRNAMPLVLLVTIILMLPALGVALVKPCVVGTTARSSKENVRSIGYSIYYTLVNIGGAAGPFLAGWVHQHFKVENVFRMAAASVFLMFVAVLLLFREPRVSVEEPQPNLRQVAANFWIVVSNPRFMLFLVIFSGYYIAFWQEFIILPIYVHDYINAQANTELLLTADPLTVVALQLLVSMLIRKMMALRAITLGTLISGLAWLILVVRPAFSWHMSLWSLWQLAKSRSSRVITNTFRDSHHPASKARIWDLRFCRLGLDRWEAVYLEDCFSANLAKCIMNLR